MLAIDNTSLQTVEDESWEDILKLENNNNTLLDATLLALTTGNLAPLIKEDLKYTIQSRRHKQGQEELKVGIPEEKVYEVKEKYKHLKFKNLKPTTMCCCKCCMVKIQLSSMF